jgi:hypothetical protein
MGNIYAQNNVGVCYANSAGVSQDHNKAAEWYLKAAEQGHADAQVNIGNAYNAGRGVPEDHKKAAEWFLKAAEQGHADAQVNIGYAYSSGRGTPQDKVKAAYWYKKASDQEDSTGMSNMGEYYRDGTGGTKQDFAKAEELFNKAIAAGFEPAKAELARLKEMQNAAPVQQDIETATMSNEDIINKVKELESNENYGEMVKLLEISAARGHAESLYELGGILYSDVGEKSGVKQDYGRAFELFNKATENGYPAWEYLGDMYFYGHGTAANKAKSIEMFTQAANVGGTYAKKRLADLMGESKTVP